jgi:hypothetical protein
VSGGFLVILFVATLLVIAPSIVALRSAWLRGGVARLGSAVAAAALVALAALMMFPSEWPASFEERVVLILFACGLVFFSLAVFTSLAFAGILLARCIRGNDR